jgi:hypothetical protein
LIITREGLYGSLFHFEGDAQDWIRIASSARDDA